MSTDVFVGLGSNLSNPVEQLISAIKALKEIPQTRLTSVSSFYRSAPVGYLDQNDFINAVARINTGLEPLPLLDQLQSIEQDHDRQRLIHWGPRTLDLDLLIYGNHCIDLPRLTVPHPQIINRRFVIEPLVELDPTVKLAGTESPLIQRLAQLQSQQMESIMPAADVLNACS